MYDLKLQIFLKMHYLIEKEIITLPATDVILEPLFKEKWFYTNLIGTSAVNILYNSL